MAQNQVINERDNPIVIEFVGIDLTLATDLKVRLGNKQQYNEVTLLLTPDVVEVQSPTTLAVYAGSLSLSAQEFNIEVIYFDANTKEFGTSITSRAIGNLDRVTVDGFSLVFTQNSYVDSFEFINYCYSRRLPLPKTQSEIDAILFDAMDYLATFEDCYKGMRTASDQPLPWPRKGVWLYNYSLASDEVPQEIKNAQMEAAAFAVENDLLPDSTGDNISKKKVGELEIEYFKGGSAKKSVRARRVMRHLQPLLREDDRLVRT